MAARKNSRTSGPHRRSQPRARVRVRDRSEFETCLFIGITSFVMVFAGMLAHASLLSYIRSAVRPSFRSEPAPSINNLVYDQAMLLAARYDSRPYWREGKLTVGAPASRPTADAVIEHLIPCESGGRPIHHLDTNGKMSYGILQFQDWPEWERISGISGDPDNTDDAIRMAEWGIQHGMIDHWGCASIRGTAPGISSR